MEKNKILIKMLLDGTGSMYGVREDTIGGVNSFIKDRQNDDEGDALFSLDVFDSESQDRIRKTAPVSEILELQSSEYKTQAMTNLYDAIAKTIVDVEDEVAERGDVLDVLVTILTDGGENASREHTKNDIRQIIERKEGEGWTFIYMGANQDAWAEAGSVGMSSGNVVTYVAAETRSAFDTMSAGTSAYIGNSRATRHTVKAGSLRNVKNVYGAAELTRDETGKGSTPDKTSTK